MDTFAGPLVVCWLALVAVIDQRTLRLPNAWILPAVAATAAAATVHVTALLAACVATAPYLVGYLMGQCGAGDVKLAFVAGGLVVGPAAAVLVVVAAQVMVLTSAWRRPADGPRAHGPPLCAATLLVLLVT